jgi:hypothetical protein
MNDKAYLVTCSTTKATFNELFKEHISAASWPKSGPVTDVGSPEGGFWPKTGT